jgi:hypothetical protein
MHSDFVKLKICNCYSLSKFHVQVLSDFFLLKSSIFWDTAPCSPVKFNRLLRGTYHLNLQRWRVRQAKYQQGAGSCLFLAWVTLEPWTWRDMFLRNIGELYSVMSRKTLTVVRPQILQGSSVVSYMRKHRLTAMAKLKPAFLQWFVSNWPKRKYEWDRVYIIVASQKYYN